MSKIKYILLFIITNITITQNAAAQRKESIIITGKTIDHQTGEPLKGATIIIKEKGTGTQSDESGNFQISINSFADTLVISYIGYKTQRRIATVGFLLVRLEQMGTQMKEVVVSTGYQTLPQERATGSFAIINQVLFNRSVGSDVISRLEDVTSGLSFDRRFTGQPSLSIRGRSTIQANDQPLIVVDNFPYDGDITNINPNDVENVTVLKDAAAASIWGARAGNGVIVITTKKGSLNRPLKIGLNANVIIGDKPNLFYNPAFLNPADFIEVEKSLFSQGFYTADINSSTHPPISPVVQILADQQNGLISSEQASAKVNALKSQDVRNDFEKYFYRKSVAQQYALNLSGGTPNVSYYFSGGYDRNLDNAVRNQSNRITLNSNSTFQPIKPLSISVHMVYTGTQQQNNNPGYSAINSGDNKSLYPYAQLADQNGNPLAVVKDYSASFVNPASANGYLNWQYKPLQELALADNTSNQTDVRINTSAKYDFTHQLSAVVSYQYQRQAGKTRYNYSDSTYYARDLINQYTQNDGSGNLSYPIPVGGILDQTSSELGTHSGRVQLNYDALFNKRHRVSAIAGFEVRQSHSASNTYRLFGYNDNVLTLQPVDEVSYFSLSPSGNNSQVPTNYSLSDYTDRYRSYFANASYTYDNKYILSGSARKDESNLFGVNTNQKGVPLWSAGLGWLVSNEAFYHITWLPYLKLRSSYGYSGNIDKTVTAYATANYSTDALTGLPNAQIQSPPNPDLRWEKTAILNVGIDFEAINGIISGSLEYYQKKGTDLIGDAPLDPTTGYFIADKYSFKGNNADIAGHGFDINLYSININGKFKWRTHYLFSYANTIVTYYAYSQAPGNYFISNPPPMTGRPQYSIYSYKWAGLDPANGNPRVYQNGAITEDYAGFLSKLSVNDLVYNGPALPPYFGAIRNTFSYKGIEASFNISYKFGYYFRRSSVSYYDLYYNWRGHQDYVNRWQKSGDEKNTDVPSAPSTADQNRDNVYLNSSALVDKGDNIRLQDVNISYHLNPDQLQHLPFSQLQIYFYANNLGILWRANHDHLDPDYSSTPYPPAKTIALGVRASF